MNWWYALLLGMVEGITEFLPVSSTAHLLIVERLLGLPQTDFWNFFTVFIQLGAILSVVAAFVPYSKDKRLMALTFTAFVPTAVVGLILYKLIKTLFFESITLMAITLILFGVVFLLVEWLIATKRLVTSKDIAKLSWVDALLLGCAQALAVVPGVSRAGIVLVTAMGRGFTRSDAALFSFLLAVPTIGAASLYDLLKTRVALSSNEIGYTAVGFIAAFISAYIVIRWLVRFLQKHSLVPFALYRILLGALLLIGGMLQ